MSNLRGKHRKVVTKALDNESRTNFFRSVNMLTRRGDDKMTEQLPKFRNNKSGKIYTLFLITNQNSERDDFPETYVYFDEERNWWSRAAIDFLKKNTKIV